MMNAVIFGAGSVGRGFIGEILFDAGYKTTFIDINETVINAINQSCGYPHVTVDNYRETRKMVENVKAVHSSNTAQVAQVIAEADLIATSVGAGVLSHIAKAMWPGLAERFDKGSEPVNVFLCENLHHAAGIMRNYLQEALPPAYHEKLDSRVGLIETSIGRMIPVPNPEHCEDHPAAVRVEPYKYLPYDIHAIKGKKPDVPALVADKAIPFAFYSDRKLYIHNMGHAMCAYLGAKLDKEYIWEVIENAEIMYFVRSAMVESALALSLKYSQPVKPLIEHIDDLIYRFSNQALNDTVERVGRDPLRKLAPEDRLIGAYKMCRELQIPNRFITIGIAAAMVYYEQSGSGSIADLFSQYDLRLLFAGQQNTDSDYSFDKLDSALTRQIQNLREPFDYMKIMRQINQSFSGSRII